MNSSKREVGDSSDVLGSTVLMSILLAGLASVCPEFMLYLRGGKINDQESCKQVLSESKLSILERFGDSDSQDMVAEIRRLRYAIRMMCTEMPTHWNELAIAEGWGDVVDTVQGVLEGEYYE